MQIEELKKSIAFFRLVINMTYMAYLDITVGFSKVIDKVDNNRPHAQKENNPIDYEKRRNSIFQFFESITHREEDLPIKYEQISTITEIRARNSEGARNQWFFANMCVVWIYQSWEDHYRKKIAAALGCKKNDILCPVFGDLRKLRNAIIHNLGVSSSDLEKTEVLGPFKRGVPLYLNEKHLRTIVENIHDYLDTLIPQ